MSEDRGHEGDSDDEVSVRRPTSLRSPASAGRGQAWGARSSIALLEMHGLRPVAQERRVVSAQSGRGITRPVDPRRQIAGMTGLAIPFAVVVGVIRAGI